MADNAITAPTVSKDGELPVTSDVVKLKNNDDPQCNLVTEDARVNNDNEVIRAASVGTVNELTNILDLYHNSLSFQLSREALEFILIRAVRNKDLLNIQQLVNAGAQPGSDFKDNDGYTALLVAAEKGFTDIARFLLEKGANINAINNNKDSALILSVVSGSTELVTLLLLNKASVNIENKDGYTALMKALESRRFDISILLFDAGAKVGGIELCRESILESCCTLNVMHGISHLLSLIKLEASSINMIKYPSITAVCSGNIEKVSELLDRRFTEVNLSNFNGTFWVKLCQTNVSNGKLDIMKVILQKGKYTDSNLPGEWYFSIVAHRATWSVVLQLLSEYRFSDDWAYKTALIIASILGHLEVLKILLNHDSCVKVQNAMKLNALRVALTFRDVDYANFLINRETQQDNGLSNYCPQSAEHESAMTGSNKDNELIRAARFGTANEVLNHLVLYQNSLSFQLSQEALECSLIHALRRGETFMALLLVGAGAQPASNYKDKDGYTALLVAAEKGFTDIVRFILVTGANVNAINDNLDSALILSVKSSGSAELVTLLLAHNANVNLENKDGSTALKKALEVRDFDTFLLLVDAGALVGAIKSHRNSVTESCVTIDNILGISYIMSLFTQEASSSNMIKPLSTGLLEAVYSGNEEKVKQLLDHQFAVNRSNENGTAWMKLSCDAKIEILKLLLKNEIVTDSNWSRESSALFVAIATNKPSIVRLFCEYNVGLSDPGAYKTALMLASELGHLEILDILLDRDSFVNVRNAIKLNALLIALKFGFDDYAKLLLSREAEINLLNTVDVNKYNLLQLAAKAGLDDIVSILIDMGADVNRVGNDGTTPLEAALIAKKGESLIRCLINNGANKDCNPLHLSMHYSIEITKFLLDSGADVNARDDYDEDTALIAAVDLQLDIEIVKLILAKGAQTNLQNIWGWTALHKATFHANVELVKLLVVSGADLEVQTRDNETAYLLAADVGNMKLIKALQKLGANTYAVNSLGCNALMCAAVTNSPQKAVRVFHNLHRTVDPSTLSLLADNEAQINHQCDKGFTALMLAAEAGNLTLMKNLLDLGADVNITNSLMSAGKEETALSILLENSDYYSTEKFACIEEVIRRGAVNSLPSRCNDMLHKMIRLNNRKMIQLLLTNGMAPAMVTSSAVSLYSLGSILQLPMSMSTSETSPLSLALALKNIQVAEYLVANLALCPCDLTTFSHSRNNLDTHMMSESNRVKFVDKFFSQPRSLLQLSFVAVSHALGGVPGREERVNSLPIPQIIKDKLMFRKEVVQMDFTEDYDDYFRDYEFSIRCRDSMFGPIIVPTGRFLRSFLGTP